MHKSPVLIYHIYTRLWKYLKDGKGDLKKLTDVPSSAHFAYNNLKNESLKRSIKRISDDLESHVYTLNEFIAFILYRRLVSTSSKFDVGIDSKAVRDMNKVMSKERFHEDLGFIKDFAAEAEYDHINDVFSTDVTEDSDVKGCVFSVFVKKGYVSPITYLFFYKRLTPELKNIIFDGNNLIIFNREIELISFFFKGVGNAN